MPMLVTAESQQATCLLQRNIRVDGHITDAPCFERAYNDR
jgi:hypothetical protein